MKEPHWLSEKFLYAVNAELVGQFGGLYGTCKKDLLHSALNRPINLFHYDKPSLFDLAAAYGFGLTRNHPFSDGNKRVALIAMQTFLDINGWELIAPEAETVMIMIALAAGEIDEKILAAWLKKYSVTLSANPLKQHTELQGVKLLSDPISPLNKDE